MGNKKQSKGQHQADSFGSMVKKAAIAQLGPDIAALVNQMGRNIGTSLAQKSASTFEELYKRIRCLEELAIEKLGVTSEELADRIADVEDKAEGYAPVDVTEAGDKVRVELKTKKVSETDYQGESLLQVSDVGTGATLGKEVEDAIVGMKTKEVKEITFGENKEMQARIYLHRVSRKPKVIVETETKTEVPSEPTNPA